MEIFGESEDGDRHEGEADERGGVGERDAGLGEPGREVVKSEGEKGPEDEGERVSVDWTQKAGSAWK